MRFIPVLVATRIATVLSLFICLALMSCRTGSDDRDKGGNLTSPQGQDAPLMGKWLLLQINRGGKDIDLDHLEGAVREIGERTYRITPMEGMTITGKYTINPESRPRTIDMMVDNGRFEGKTLKGIYRIKGDKLTISFGTPGKGRPAVFDSSPGTEHTVAIHKQVK